MKRKRRKEKNNTKIAVIFFVFVFAILLISAIFKLILIIRQSRFDDSSRFTVSVLGNKYPELISFSKNPSSISVLELDRNTNSLSIGRFLEAPIDGTIKAVFLKKTDNVSSLFSKALFDYKDIKTNLNLIDVLKLYLFSKTVNSGNISKKIISPSDDKTTRDLVVSSLLSDPRIAREKASVEIINATDVYGLGDRLARLITNMGGNVVLVLSSQDEKPFSSIYYTGERTYTVKRLGEILGFKTSRIYTKEIADVIIEIGKDSKSGARF